MGELCANTSVFLRSSCLNIEPSYKRWSVRNGQLDVKPKSHLTLPFGSCENVGNISSASSRAPSRCDACDNAAGISRRGSDKFWDFTQQNSHLTMSRAVVEDAGIFVTIGLLIST